mmetsp:Transcript_101565/g.254677  ORF Transcript_101565/g.254677 Transcript_101565/m.254677 type:complete len:200 (+) Transcript_101565:564-1163(+)
MPIDHQGVVLAMQVRIQKYRAHNRREAGGSLLVPDQVTSKDDIEVAPLRKLRAGRGHLARHEAPPVESCHIQSRSCFRPLGEWRTQRRQPVDSLQALRQCDRLGTRQVGGQRHAQPARARAELEISEPWLVQPQSALPRLQPAQERGGGWPEAQVGGQPGFAAHRRADFVHGERQPAPRTVGLLIILRQDGLRRPRPGP